MRVPRKTHFPAVTPRAASSQAARRRSTSRCALVPTGWAASVATGRPRSAGASKGDGRTSWPYSSVRRGYTAAIRPARSIQRSCHCVTRTKAPTFDLDAERFERACFLQRTCALRHHGSQHPTQQGIFERRARVIHPRKPSCGGGGFSRPARSSDSASPQGGLSAQLPAVRP